MNEERIRHLEAEIIKHKNLYYQGKPQIDDFTYDAMEEELRELDPSNQVLHLVGSEVFSGEKVPHQTKMLSLNKTYSIDELLSWKGSYDVLSTFKIDGTSCSLIYEKGKLVMAKTRGNGSFGENITSKILFLDKVPRVLKEPLDAEVRGELFCTEEEFIHLSQEMEKRGLEKPTSQRNIVAGLLGRKENIDLCAWLSFQAFGLIADHGMFELESQKLKKLQDLGFETPDYFINKTEKDIEERLDETKNFMSEGDYLLDGLVFTFNDLHLHEEFGETSHHPRYKMAFKFQGEAKTTTLNNITWQVSRNGFLTPVGEVEPVELSGAIVGRVTLHNYGMVKQHNLKKGDKIEIVRSGEVIPKFLSVVESSSNPIAIPEKCPSCGQEVFIEDIRLLCRNKLCPDKIKDEILNYIKKIGIDDLSSKRLEELIRAQLVVDIPSLYDLTEEKLMTMEKVKEKLASKIVGNIEASKKVDLPTFLSALGIAGGAKNKCEKIVDYGFDTIEKIKNLTIEQLMGIESFAEKSATEFLLSLSSKKELIDKLLEKGMKISKPQKAVDSKISGMKFCITGTLSMKRSDLQKMIKAHGGICVTSVTKNTDYLITNDEQSSSSKFKKALELNIPILNEKDFLKMVE